MLTDSADVESAGTFAFVSELSKSASEDLSNFLVVPIPLGMMVPTLVEEENLLKLDKDYVGARPLWSVLSGF